jgi:hypothetical protein
MLRSFTIFVLMILLPLTGVAPVWAAVAPGAMEKLEYRVSLGIINEAAQAKLTLTPRGPGRYVAEFSGAARGIFRLVENYLPERYQTEMFTQKGRLLPLVYREIFHKKGERIIREYRFDYQRHRLELWRQAGDQPMAKRWQLPLQEPVYDVLSFFYNLRQGAFGPLDRGSTVRVQLVPTPEPAEMILRIGLDEERGRKAMLTVKDAQGESEPYYFYFTPDWVPSQVWTRVMAGKLAGTLLDRGAISHQDLVARPGAPGDLAEQVK